MMVATAGEVQAWGPITHQKIVEDARDAMEAGEIKNLWTDYPQYMHGGAIAPDWCLAYAKAKSSAEDANEVALHQGDFHSQEFLEAMKALADTDEEKAFYYAYKSHVISDEYEGELGNVVKSKPGDYALEFYVDMMVVVDGYKGETGIKICADLMAAAYEISFPNSQWQPTVRQINTLCMTNRVYQWFWLPYISGISAGKGYDFYSEYRTFVNTSVLTTETMVFIRLT